MGREVIRRATVALQRAAEAMTLEFQARYADEARAALEEGVRLVRARFESAELRPSAPARMIARHAVVFEIEALQELEARLAEVEARIAEAIVARRDPHDLRRLRLAK